MSLASPHRVAGRRSPALLYLFPRVRDREALLAARSCGADVLIQELEQRRDPAGAGSRVTAPTAGPRRASFYIPRMDGLAARGGQLKG